MQDMIVPRLHDFRLPTRQAREEEQISTKLANDAKRLAGLCSSRVLNGLPLGQKMAAMQEVQDSITELHNLWIKDPQP